MDDAEVVCRLEPINSTTKPIFLPDSEEVAIGRSCELNVPVVQCSKQQLSLVADYKEQVVCVTVCGRGESAIDDKSLNYGEAYIATNGSVIELVKGVIRYKLTFCKNLKRTFPEEASSRRDMDSFTWEMTCSNELLIGIHPSYDPYRKKVAAFDLDGTLIKTKSGHTFPKNCDDWTLWDNSVKPALAELQNNGYQIVIFTNQAALGMPRGKMLLKDFKKKVESIVRELGVPAAVYISTTDGFYRKPAPGMWDVLKSKHQQVKHSPVESFFVGDAAGRPENWKPGKKADFSISDRLFAFNTQLKFYTPEEFFLKESPASFIELKFKPDRYDLDGTLIEPDYTFPTEENEVILMVGSPASGKTHFVAHHLVLREYHVVSRDISGTWQKCVAALKELLDKKKNVVIDNTNPDIISRQRYIEVCKEKNVKVRCFQMTTSLNRCLHNNKYRQITNSNHTILKSSVIKNFFSSLEPPTLDEGFAEIVQVPFVPLFKNVEYERIYNYHIVS